MKRMIPALVAGLSLGATAAFAMGSSDTPEVAVADPAPAQTSEAAKETAAQMPSAVTEMTLGVADAPVTIVEYASFTCPHCATFHEGPLKQLKADYVDTGKVKFTFREAYFDRFGLWASMLARCDGEARFFGLTDALMKGQSEWLKSGDPVGISAALSKIGLAAGLSKDQVNACITDNDKAKELLTWYQTNQAADNINATPSLVINGELHSNMSYADLKKIIDAKLAQ